MTYSNTTTRLDKCTMHRLALKGILEFSKSLLFQSSTFSADDSLQVQYINQTNISKERYGIFEMSSSRNFNTATSIAEITKY